MIVFSLIGNVLALSHGAVIGIAIGASIGTCLIGGLIVAACTCCIIYGPCDKGGGNHGGDFGGGLYLGICLGIVCGIIMGVTVGVVLGLKLH